MNWEAIGALGEWIGALAVLATLGYLALQIKQNSQSMRSNTEIEASRQLAGLVARISADSNLKRIYDDVADNKELPLEDRRDFTWLLAEFFHSAEGIYIQHSKGFLSEEIWGEYERVMIGFLQSREAQDWWNNDHAPFSKLFVDYVEELRSNPIEWSLVPSAGAREA